MLLFIVSSVWGEGECSIMSMDSVHILLLHICLWLDSAGMCECCSLPRLRLERTFSGHIVLAYANFCSIKTQSVMSNFPRHQSEFLIHFCFVISSCYKGKREDLVSRGFLSLVVYGTISVICVTCVTIKAKREGGRGWKTETERCWLF